MEDKPKIGKNAENINEDKKNNPQKIEKNKKQKSQTKPKNEKVSSKNKSKTTKSEKTTAIAKKQKKKEKQKTVRQEIIEDTHKFLEKEASIAVKSIRKISKSYNSYVNRISKKVLGKELDKIINDELSKIFEVNFLEIFNDFEINEEKMGHFLDNAFDGEKIVKNCNNYLNNIVKNVKSSAFVNVLNYSMNMNNFLTNIKKNPFVPNVQINFLKDFLLKNSMDFIVDYMMDTTVDEFRFKDGSLNNEFIDLVLNNVRKITKESYWSFPEVYHDIIDKVIPGGFISSLLTFNEDKNELEKVVDMLINLSTSHLSDLSVPLIEDPFFGILSILNPKQKKERTIVETLGDAIKRFDISGVSKVKAAGILINRASDFYEEHKNAASNFLHELVSSIPVVEDKKPKIESKEATLSKNTNNEKKTNIIENENPISDIMGKVAQHVLDGGWTNFDLIEKEMLKFWN